MNVSHSQPCLPSNWFPMMHRPLKGCSTATMSISSNLPRIPPIPVGRNPRVVNRSFQSLMVVKWPLHHCHPPAFLTRSVNPWVFAVSRSKLSPVAVWIKATVELNAASALSSSTTLRAFCCNMSQPCSLSKLASRGHRQNTGGASRDGIGTLSSVNRPIRP